MARIRKINGIHVIEGAVLGEINDLFLDCSPDNYIDVEIKIIDTRRISEKQRNFIFALCDDISFYTGDEKNYCRIVMQYFNANLREIEVESLSNCSMTYANGLIDTIINHCIDQRIPISGDIIKKNNYRFGSKQVYIMCFKRICAVCGARADIHHVDHVGIGNNRKKISHIGKRVLPLCRKHHSEIHNVGEDKYIDMNCLTPVRVDDKMDYFIKKGKLKFYKEERKNE